MGRDKETEQVQKSQHRETEQEKKLLEGVQEDRKLESDLDYIQAATRRARQEAQTWQYTVTSAETWRDTTTSRDAGEAR